MATLLGQLCTAEYDSTGSLKFRINSSVDFVEPGDLPFADVFVHRIVINNDPKSDKFWRVANVLDLTTLPRGRDAALAKKTTDYLRTEFDVVYDDVHTATAAKNLIQARVDSLIADWLKYNRQFVNPNVFELPAVQSTIVTEAEADYEALKETREAKESALIQANDALSDAQAGATRATSDLVAAQGRVALCTQNLRILSDGTTAAALFRNSVVNFRNTIQSFLVASTNFHQASSTFETSVSSGVNPTYEPALASYALALSSFEAAFSGTGGFSSILATEEATSTGPLTAAVAAFTAECAHEQTQLELARTAKTAADAAVAKAQTDQAIAEREAERAKRDEEAALAKLIEVCPDYQAAA